jgi:hypothetical protein
MPLRNRVTPMGDIIADAARGTLMGNRGTCTMPAGGSAPRAGDTAVGSVAG